jgi:hypothetical protein
MVEQYSSLYTSIITHSAQGLPHPKVTLNHLNIQHLRSLLIITPSPYHYEEKSIFNYCMTAIQVVIARIVTIDYDY